MPVPHHTADPWTRVQSPHGFCADELISAFQKFIRRGLLEDAILVAREMFETSPALEDKMWQRLLVISVEDVGAGNVMAPVVVQALHRMRQGFPHGSGDRWVFGVQAVRYLAEQPKDRTTSELTMWAAHMLSTGERLPEIPDYALDVHTRRGQELGRSTLHFLLESSQVANEIPDRDERYRQRMVAAAESGEWRD